MSSAWSSCSRFARSDHSAPHAPATFTAFRSAFGISRVYGVTSGVPVNDRYIGRAAASNWLIGLRPRINSIVRNRLDVEYMVESTYFRFVYGVSGMAWKEQGSRRTFLARNPKDPGMIATRFVLQKSLAAFRSGGRPPASAEDGRDVLEVIAAAYRSAEIGCRVAVNPETARELASLQMGAAPTAAR